MTANPIRPARHRAGKPTGVDSSSDESSEDETTTAQPKRAPPPKATSASRITSSISSAQQRRDEEQRRSAAKKEIARVEQEAAAEGFVTESESEEEGEPGVGEEAEEDEESSEEEESSEDEKPRLMIRPRFIPKSQRGNQVKTEEERKEEETKAKKAQLDALIEETVKQDLATREARKTFGTGDNEEDVDDRDGLDPDAELAAFKLRKLKRYKRDREAMLAKEREIEELERRRNMTEEERLAEDEKKIQKQKEEKESRGKMGYMQKYHHRGAFYTDATAEAGLANRDVMGAKFEDEVDRSQLPEYMQRRDMTRLGKKGATKYKDLRSEDTGVWGSIDREDRRRNHFGGDERFREDDRFRPGGGEGRGANAMPLGERKPVPDAPTGPKADRGPRRDDGGGPRRDRERSGDRGDSYRPGNDRRRDRSRSRSPREPRDSYRRKRSNSRDRYRDEKRRRVDA
jgi:microfibrillar-associated protein 1